MTRQRSGLGAAPSTGGGGGGTDASALTTGVVAKARGGFGADMSAASGIVKWTAGVISFLTAPASAVLGLTDTQSPTNKTLDSSNSIDAAAIKSGTLAKARGGFAADMSAATGLPKFAAGVLSFLTAPAGALVGDTDTQTLSGKTLTTPTINNPVISDSSAATGSAGEVLARSSASGNLVWCPPPGVIQPEDAGFLEWSEDILTAIVGGAIGSAGVLYLRRVRFREARTITGIGIIVGLAGATLTAGQCMAGLWQGGANIGVTVDQSTAWQSTGLKQMALTSTASVAKGDAYVGFWSQGSTQPRFSSVIASPNFTNGRSAAASARAVSANTGVTTTAPPTLGTLSLTGAIPWVGVY